jgi:hypothetical protein
MKKVVKSIKQRKRLRGIVQGWDFPSFKWWLGITPITERKYI